MINDDVYRGRCSEKRRKIYTKNRHARHYCSVEDERIRNCNDVDRDGILIDEAARAVGAW